MPVSADTLALLIEKGLSGSDLVDVVRAIDVDGANAEPVRSLRQERNRRHYQKRKASENVSIKTSEQDAQSAPLPPQRDINQTPSSPRKSDHRADDAKSILAEVLPDEAAADLIAHRKALRSPMTPGSARGLVKAFVAFGNPEAAAQAMMANGWKGFRPEWLANQQPRAGPPRPAGRSLADMAMMHLDEPDIFDDPGSFHQPDNPAGPAEGAQSSDAGRRGFAGRLSVEDAAAARRSALLDH